MLFRSIRAEQQRRATEKASVSSPSATEPDLDAINAELSAAANAPTNEPMQSPFRRSPSFADHSDDQIKELVSKRRASAPTNANELLDLVLAEEELHARGLSDKKAEVIKQLRKGWEVASDEALALKWKSGVNHIMTTLVPEKIKAVQAALAQHDFEAAEQHLNDLARLAEHADKWSLPSSPKARERIKSTLTEDERATISRAIEGIRDIHKQMSIAVAAYADRVQTPVAKKVASRIQAQRELPLDKPAAASPAPASTPETDEFGFSTEDIPEPTSEPSEEDLAPAPASEPSPTVENNEWKDEEARLREKVAALREKAAAARAKASEIRKRMSFMPDPKEQAYADARVFSTHLDLGLALLKLGYVKFRVWAAQMLQQLGTDGTSLYSLRRIYRMLRDDAGSTRTLLNNDEDYEYVRKLMDPATATNTTLIGNEPAEKAPGYFGDMANMLDWVGNTTFFQGEMGQPGTGRMHRIFVEKSEAGSSILPVLSIAYIANKKVVYTGDTIGQNANGDWVFEHVASKAQRENKLRPYTTSNLSASFVTDHAAPVRMQESGEARDHAARVRDTLDAINSLYPVDREGRLSFINEDRIARWAAAARWVDDQGHRLPIKAQPISQDRVAIIIPTARAERAPQDEPFSQVVEQTPSESKVPKSEQIEYEKEGIEEAKIRNSPNERVIEIDGGGMLLTIKLGGLISSFAPRNSIWIQGLYSEKKGAETRLAQEAARIAVEANRPLAWGKSPWAQEFYKKLGFKSDEYGNFVVSVSELRQFLERQSAQNKDNAQPVTNNPNYAPLVAEAELVDKSAWGASHIPTTSEGTPIEIGRAHV